MATKPDARTLKFIQAHPDVRTLKFIRKDLRVIRRILDDNPVLARQIVVNLLEWINYHIGEEIDVNK